MFVDLTNIHMILHGLTETQLTACTFALTGHVQWCFGPYEISLRFPM